MAWAPDYVTAEQLEDYLKAQALDSGDDLTLETAVASASRAVDGHCLRQFGQVDAPEARTYTAWWDYSRCVWVVDVDDVADDEPTVTVAGETVTGWTLEPANAVVKGKVWTRLTLPRSALSRSTGLSVSVEAVWGWPQVPTPVVQATLLQASRFSNRRQSPYGIAGSPEAGSEMRLLSRVDPDVRVALTGWRRKRRAA